MPVQATRDTLLQANARFYEVFEALDYAAMEAMWAQHKEVYCVHPGWNGLRGAGPVLDSWRRILANTGAINFTLTQVEAHIVGDVGIVTLYENISSEVHGERHTATTVATNLFHFDAAAPGWKLIHHHASPTAAPPEADQGALN